VARTAAIEALQMAYLANALMLSGKPHQIIRFRQCGSYRLFDQPRQYPLRSEAALR